MGYSRHMSDFYDDDELDYEFEFEDDEDNDGYLHSSPIQPQKYNIILTREGDEIDFEFPAATPEMIERYGYISPIDERCKSGLVNEDEDLYERLRPVIGQTFNGELAYHTRKQVIIALHDTAILGYQRQTIIDPRISNEIATFWEIYLDHRIFPQADQGEWKNLMAEVIKMEISDELADQKLAEDIKDRLLEQARD